MSVSNAPSFIFFPSHISLSPVSTNPNRRRPSGHRRPLLRRPPLLSSARSLRRAFLPPLLHCLPRWLVSRSVAASNSSSAFALLFLCSCSSICCSCSPRSALICSFSHFSPIWYDLLCSPFLHNLRCCPLVYALCSLQSSLV